MRLIDRYSVEGCWREGNRNGKVPEADATERTRSAWLQWLNKAERVCGRRACLGPLKACWLPPSVSLEAIGGFGAETWHNLISVLTATLGSLSEGKHGSRNARYEIIAAIWRRDNGDLVGSDNRGAAEKSLDFGYILKEKLTEFDKALSVRYVKKESSQEYSDFWL